MTGVARILSVVEQGNAEIAKTIGGTKQYIIEEEGRMGPEALEACRRAAENFRKMDK